MKTATIRKNFERYLREQGLRFTSQRQRIFDSAFETHEHFSAETLYAWLAAEKGAKVSRATVYRTLALLVDGGFLDSLDTGRGELMYEHIVGHEHHDHMVCVSCGRIDEFRDPRIELLQEENARNLGFVTVEHDLRLFGYCKTCVRSGLCPLVPGGRGELPRQSESELGKPRKVGTRVPGRGARGDEGGAPRAGGPAAERSGKSSERPGK
jgi:Fur family transcriptional regulator, ferric uptake regulator